MKRFIFELLLHLTSAISTGILFGLWQENLAAGAFVSSLILTIDMFWGDLK